MLRIAGIDEVGRGCWAGPLVAGAVVLPGTVTYETVPIKLGDSKKLSKKQREGANYWIKMNAIACGLGWVWSDEIDDLGLTRAVGLAMRRALDACGGAYDQLIIDGSINYCPQNPKASAVIKADATVPAVSAASVIAKVARDDYMTNLDVRYAKYGFNKHVGYGTALHIAALKQYGVSDIHRRSYKPVKALLT